MLDMMTLKTLMKIILRIRLNIRRWWCMRLHKRHHVNYWTEYEWCFYRCSYCGQMLRKPRMDELRKSVMVHKSWGFHSK